MISSYNDVSASSRVTVLSTITTSDATGEYLNSKVTSTFLDTAGKALAYKQVTFKVGDEIYSATTNANGVASFNFKLNPGTYTVISYFEGDDTYEACSLSVEITVPYCQREIVWNTSYLNFATDEKENIPD